MIVFEDKILITGATGGLGKQLVYHLVNMGVRPIAHCRKTSDTSYIDSQNLEKRFADLRDHDALAKVVEGVDAIIHTAAMVNFRRDRLTQFTGINTFGAVDMYKAARKAGVKRFVHVSSVVGVGAQRRTNGNGAQPPVNEEHEFNLGHLRVPYILSKQAAEDELRALAREGGPELIIVNPSIIVAPSRSNNDRPRADRIFGRWFMPDYPNIVNLVDVRDVAAGVVAALEKGKAGERYILAGDNISARELVLAVSVILGRMPHLVRIPKPMVNAAARFSLFWAKLTGRGKVSFYPDLVRMADYDWTYSSMKARRELGYQSRSIHLTLEDLLNHEFTGTWQKPAVG